MAAALNQGTVLLFWCTPEPSVIRAFAVQVLMKDVRTGKKVFFVPQLAWAGGNDDVDPPFITDVGSNKGANDISVVRMCACSPCTCRLCKCHAVRSHLQTQADAVQTPYNAVMSTLRLVSGMAYLVVSSSYTVAAKTLSFSDDVAAP